MSRLKRGIYITVDGIDGCGKTETVNFLSEQIGKHFDTFKFGALTTNKVSAKIRAIYTDNNTVMHAKTEALLLAAAHWENWYANITKLLEEGYVVIGDRSPISALAYQGYAEFMMSGTSETYDLIKPVLNRLVPHYRVIINANVMESLERVKTRDGKKDRMESRPVRYHEHVSYFMNNLEEFDLCLPSISSHMVDNTKDYFHFQDCIKKLSVDLIADIKKEAK